MFRGGTAEMVTFATAAFEAGRLRALAGIYAVPLPIFVDDAVLTYQCRGDLLQGLSALRTHFGRMGLLRAEGRLLEETPCRDGAFEARISLRYAFAGGRTPVTNELVYFCRRPFGPDAPELEVGMVQYRRRGLDMPPLDAQAARTLDRASPRRPPI
jgi:hypothetical protein